MKRTKPGTREREIPRLPARLNACAVYPFSAIVGQDEIKLGLILNVIDPSIGGVLMMGHRGTGKSTAVRALADLLPEITVSRDCCFNCEPNDAGNLCADCAGKLTAKGKLQTRRISVPVVDLPLGATEDRVCGSIDIQRALTQGVKAFEPGLLARANRGFLYIDEVNLLEDHLVDLLLDVAVTGRNKVERENISIEHPAQFVLIGSGNPEEGELRPQLLDRFGLYIEVKTENDIDDRVEIVTRRESFERNQREFCASFGIEQKKLQRRIARATRDFAGVKVETSLLRQIATLCSELKVDGHRGELTIMRAARALAAFGGRRTVTEADVRRVALISLRHRLHNNGLSDTAGEAKIEQALDRAFSGRTGITSIDNGGKAEGGGNGTRGQRFDLNGRDAANSEKDIPSSVAVDVELPSLSAGRSSKVRSIRKSQSRRSKAAGRTDSSRSGRYISARARRSAGARIAIDATLRALLAAGFGVLNIPPTADALRFKHFARKRGTLFICAIDTSGSMALARISKAKGAALNLLKESYVNRDSVAIIGFRGTQAELLLPPSRSIVRARRVLDKLSVGGGTPLSAALACSLAVAERATRQQDGRLVLLLFTDGGANVPLETAPTQDRMTREKAIAKEVALLGARLRASQVRTFVIETQNNFVSKGRTQILARMLGAQHLSSDKWEQSTSSSTPYSGQSA